MPASVRVLFVLVGLSAASCGGGGGSSAGQPSPGAVMAETRPDAVTRTDLVDLLGTAELEPVGLTLTPDTGELVLLDAEQGVYVLDDDRRFVRAVSTQDLLAQVDTASGFTDIAAVGADVFALTARNDGFRLDLSSGTIEQHFCYVPWVLPPDAPQLEQLTESVAFDSVHERILVQPITMNGGLGILGSSYGTFPMTGGVGEDWYAIWRGFRFFGAPFVYLAGAMSVDARGEVWMVQGDELERYTKSTGELVDAVSLAEVGVEEVSGMAFDGDDLFVLDSADLELVHVPAAVLAELGLPGWPH